MDRRSFLKMSFFAAAGAPGVAKAWEKPLPAFDPSEDWPQESWEDAYAPGDFIYVKPTVTPIGERKVAIIWKTREIATGWALVSQDGGATWTKVWSGDDGICDTLRTTHIAVFEDYDSAKPLKYRAVSRPIAEYGRFGQVRYSGETIVDGKLSGYYIGKGYRPFAKARAEKYTGEEFVEEGEIAALDPNALEIVMFNDVHHAIPFYPKLLKSVPSRLSLAVFAGDICDHARSTEDFDKHLMAPMAYLSRHTQCLTRFVRGNHETMGLYAPHVRNHVALQDNAFYGAVTLGGTRIVFLDTGNDVHDNGRPDPDCYYRMEPYFAQENAWLKREVASAEWRNAKTRIAFAHIPPTYAKPDAKIDAKTGKPRPCYTAGAPIGEMYRTLGDAGLSLLCAGHMHDAAWIGPAEGRPFPMAIGGGPSDKRGNHGIGIATVTRLTIKNHALGGDIDVVQTDLNGEEVFRVGLNHKAIP